MKRTRLLSVLLVAAGVGTLTTVPARAEAGAPAWRVVKGTALERASALLDVAASGPGNVWAVGYGCSAEDREGCGAVERWDGARWRKVKIPGFDHVEGVSVTSTKNVWLTGNGVKALAAHWNGSRWTTHAPFGSSPYNYLHDVATAGGRAWFAAAAKDTKAVVLAWTKGGGFTRAFSTAGAFKAITTRAATGDVWAVGTAGGRPLAVLGRGGTWKVTPTPAIPGGHLTRVWQVSRNDVWAVGYAVGKTDFTWAKDRLAASRPISLHYDGTSWKEVPVPVAKGQLSGLTADASGTVWASGVDLANGRQVLFLTYVGGRWTKSYGPRLPIPNQRDYDVQTVRMTSITRVPGSGALWTVVAAGGGDFEKEFILRRG